MSFYVVVLIIVGRTEWYSAFVISAEFESFRQGQISSEASSRGTSNEVDIFDMLMGYCVASVVSCASRSC